MRFLTVRGNPDSPSATLIVKRLLPSGCTSMRTAIGLWNVRNQRNLYASADISGVLVNNEGSSSRFRRNASLSAQLAAICPAPYNYWRKIGLLCAAQRPQEKKCSQNTLTEANHTYLDTRPTPVSSKIVVVNSNFTNNPVVRYFESISKNFGSTQIISPMLPVTDSIGNSANPISLKSTTSNS
jgi:hypothetical protein